MKVIGKVLMVLVILFLLVSSVQAADQLVNVKDGPKNDIAGEVTTHKIYFTLTSNLTVNDTVEIEFPSGFKLLLLSVGKTENINLTYKYKTNQRVILNVEENVSAWTACSIEINNIRNTLLPGEYNVIVDATNHLSTYSACFAIVSPSPAKGKLGVTDVLANYYGAETTNHLINFTAIKSIEASGKVVIGFPTNFTLYATKTSLGSVYPETYLTLHGVVPAKNEVKLNVTKAIPSMTRCSVTLNNIRNPLRPNYYTISVKTEDAAGNVLDGSIHSGQFEIKVKTLTMERVKSIRDNYLRLLNAFLSTIETQTATELGKITENLVDILKTIFGGLVR